MGATPSQMRRLLGSLLGASLALVSLLFVLWWSLLAQAAPPLAFDVDVLGRLELSWILTRKDLVWLAGWLLASYLAAYWVLGRQLHGLCR